MRTARHGRWSLLLAVALAAAGCGAERPVEDPATKEASIGGDQPVSAAGICSRWDCTGNCCSKVSVPWVGTITVCEPVCKSTCETHNAACDPSFCAVIRVTDPAYDARLSAWQAAQRAGLFSTQAACEGLAGQAADTIASELCGVAGGIYCTVPNDATKQQNFCFCADVSYGSSTGGGGGGTAPPPSCSGTCCDWDENGVCTSCVKRPAVCP